MTETKSTPPPSPPLPSEPTPPPSTSSNATAPIDHQPAPSPFLYLLTLCASIGGFLFGYDTGVISGALVLLQSPQGFALSKLQSEAVVAAAVGGAIAGAALSGIGNDKFGRRQVILVSSTLFTAGAVPLYIAEASPPQIRGRLVSLNSALITGGQFFASVLDALLADTEGGWRYMLGLAAIPAIVQFAGFLALPKSPHYLVSKGRNDEARAALLKIRGEQEIDVELEHIKAELQGSKLEDSNVWEELSFALSISTSVNWVSNLLVSFTFLSTIDALAPYGAFWLYAVVSLFGFVYLWRELPETKGLELEEIQRIFASRVKYSAVSDKSTKNAHIQEA
ncbi:hypothetical protein JG688_00010275 [Phytophthora aleatoria]|uniref:Major facilitator superfamily (MFS) profile domain-containing protein n=1 Tax=Phytophthora aleatoria TaxID=2496075 RepID=A0A8J5IWB2_9STRA|nr:hypothetical protein JG688_00010275 [Phytophthora aleatoria]